MCFFLCGSWCISIGCWKEATNAKIEILWKDLQGSIIFSILRSYLHLEGGNSVGPLGLSNGYWFKFSQGY